MGSDRLGANVEIAVRRRDRSSTQVSGGPSRNGCTASPSTSSAMPAVRIARTNTGSLPRGLPARTTARESARWIAVAAAETHAANGVGLADKSTKLSLDRGPAISQTVLWNRRAASPANEANAARREL